MEKKRKMNIELKSLQTRKAQLEVEITQLMNSRKDVQKKLDEKNAALNGITRQIQNIADKKPIISEHALLRYAERVLGIDFESIKKDILSEQNVAIIDTLRSGIIPVKNFKLIVKDKVIVTIE
jgi:chromosome segregation ATPase